MFSSHEDGMGFRDPAKWTSAHGHTSQGQRDLEEGKSQKLTCAEHCDCIIVGLLHEIPKPPDR